MSLFKSKPKHVYNAPTGPITLSRQQFKTMVRTQGFVNEYKAAVGMPLFETALDDAFTESLRSMNAQGFWAFGTSAGPFGNTNLKFRDAGEFDTFINTAIASFFRFDLNKVRDRRNYIQRLRAQTDGTLYTQLTNESEPEANYYTPPPPVAVVGAPPIPAKTGDVLNTEKCLAWLTRGVQGDTSAYSSTLMNLKKFDGSFPLGADRRLLFQAYPGLVPGAPAYRGWNNVASQQKYPSNVGGMKLLDETLSGLAGGTMPPRGNNRWYGLALFVFGAIMTSQPFTDGNKRMSRLAYALMILSGGVPMIAPNATMGARLGDMM